MANASSKRVKVNNEENRLLKAPDDVLEHLIEHLSWTDLANQMSVSQGWKHRITAYLKDMSERKDEDGNSYLRKMCAKHTICNVRQEVVNKFTEELGLKCYLYCVERFKPEIDQFSIDLFAFIQQYFVNEHIDLTRQAFESLEIRLEIGMGEDYKDSVFFSNNRTGYKLGVPLEDQKDSSVFAKTMYNTFVDFAIALFYNPLYKKAPLRIFTKVRESGNIPGFRQFLTQNGYLLFHFRQYSDAVKLWTL